MGPACQDRGVLPVVFCTVRTGSKLTAAAHASGGPVPGLITSPVNRATRTGPLFSESVSSTDSFPPDYSSNCRNRSRSRSCPGAQSGGHSESVAVLSLRAFAKTMHVERPHSPQLVFGRSL